MYQIILLYSDNPVTRPNSLRDFDSDIITSSRLFNGFLLYLHGLHNNLKVSGRSNKLDSISYG